MAIPSTAQFSHSVALEPGPEGVWCGTAVPADQDGSLVGDAPAVELSGGVLTLQRRLSLGARLVRGLARESKVTKARFAVGEALESVIKAGDVLHLDRGAMAELSVVLMREGHLVVALGAIAGSKGTGVTIEVDPRADDVRFYYMRSLLDRPDSQLVWLDPQSVDYEQQLAELGRIPAHVSMVSIAARCPDWQTSAAVNHRAVEDPSRRRHWGFNYETVGMQFRTREEFIAHLRGMPEQRPNDFFLRFLVDGTVAEVREGQCRVHEDWLFSVYCVASLHDGWSRSHAGVARAHPSLTPDRLHTSVRLTAEGPVQFEPA